MEAGGAETETEAGLGGTKSLEAINRVGQGTCLSRMKPSQFHQCY